MVQQQIAAPNRGKNIDVRRQTTRPARREALEFQIRSLDHVRHRHQASQINRAIAVVDIFWREIELVLQQAGHLIRTGIGHFQAHRVAETALMQFTFQRVQQILNVFVLHEQLAVAGDAELIAAGDAHARK